uniref:ATP synthase subunit b n=1 Tax=Urocitellus parryii TaxID=9999 RepID=A0A8D2H0N5_UROPR
HGLLVVLFAAAKAALSQKLTGPSMLGTGLIFYFISREIDVIITPETFSPISIVGLLVYVIKKYGASTGIFIDNEQKIAQLEEVKKASIKHIQENFPIELEKSKQALVQKHHYLFDVQGNNIAMALERGKELPGLSYLCAEYDASKGTGTHDKLGGEACVQSISAQRENEATAKCITDLQLLERRLKQSERATAEPHLQPRD